MRARLAILNSIIFLLFISVYLVSCGGGYGKRIKINDNTEVYIKGDGVTDADGKKFGEYFVNKFKDLKQEKSFQLSKDSSGYVVRMIVDPEKLKNDKTLDVSFMAIQMLFELEAFPGSKVKLILTDNEFKDYKTYSGQPSSNTDSLNKQ